MLSNVDITWNMNTSTCGLYTPSNIMCIRIIVILEHTEYKEWNRERHILCFRKCRDAVCIFCIFYVCSCSTFTTKVTESLFGQFLVFRSDKIMAALFCIVVVDVDEFAACSKSRNCTKYSYGRRAYTHYPTNHTIITIIN